MSQDTQAKVRKFANWLDIYENQEGFFFFLINSNNYNK